MPPPSQPRRNQPVWFPLRYPQYARGMRNQLAILLLLVSSLVRADPPADAQPLAADAALACVAARYHGESLRIREKDGGLVQDIRWLTPAGNVLKLELTGPGCQFLEIDGVGQMQARRPPEKAQ